MAKKIVALNLKMNHDYEEATNYVKVVKNKISDKHDIIILPSSLHLELFKDCGYKLGAQNVYSEDKGAFTGEISPLQLKSAGIEYAVIGHSERRHYFNEDDDLINKKIRGCLNNNLKIILCIGETSEQRRLNKTAVVIDRQLRDGFKGLDADDLSDIIIAYEPVWSIGTGHTPQMTEISDAIQYIKKVIDRQYNTKIKVLYGGSVNQENITTIMALPDVDGVLVGTASIDPHYVLKMIELID